MSLRFVIGRSGSGKTTYITKEMIEKLQEDPMGSPIIYIVPDQMTFLSEYKLISNPKIKGMFRLQVFSLTRLAWRVLQETGGIRSEERRVGKDGGEWVLVLQSSIYEHRQ